MAGMADVAFGAPAPTITSPSPLPNSTEFAAYTYTLTCTVGGGPPYTWSITSGSLPSGLSLNASMGVISGTPVVSGNFSFTVQVRDSAGKTDSKAFTMTVIPKCAFVGTNIGSISFGNIDPSTTPGPITSNSVTQQVLFQCDTTLTYSFAKIPANPSLISGGNSILFTLGLAASGLNTTNLTQISLLTTTSSISQPDYQNAVTGSYNSGNISITISWGGTYPGSINATATALGTVIKTCAVTQSAGTLTFNIDPSVAGTTTGTIAQDLKIKCTKSASIAISASSSCGGATPKLSSSYPPVCGGFQIPYTFNISNGVTGAGFGAGSDLALGIGGTVDSANYINAPVGNYGDLETVTITY
jgi:hypothetical protein